MHSEQSLSKWLADPQATLRELDRIDCEQNHLRFVQKFFQEKEAAPLIVGPHHRVISRTLDRVLSGEVKRLIINIPPGYSKAIDVGSAMLTKRGWVEAKDVVVGDYLVASDGGWTRVEGVFPQGVKPAYLVEFEDGAALRVCDEHLWGVLDRYTPTLKTKRTSDLRAALTEGAEKRKKWRIPLVAPLARPDADLPIDPYLFGCWLGDGHTHQAAITTMDPEIVAAFESGGYVIKAQKHQNAGRATTYAINRGLSPALRALGVLGRKFVPNIYLDASAAQRLALLQGLMDTDGCVATATGQQTFNSTNPDLTRAFRFLVASLGGSCRTFREKHCEADTSYFRLPPSLPPCRLARKLSKRNPRTAHGSPRRLIASIEPDGYAEMVCFKVDAPDSLFAAGPDLVLTHNTEFAVVHFIAHGLALNPKARFIHASFNGPLALFNSNSVRDVIALEGFQALWPIAIRDDVAAKELWRTPEGGGMKASAAGGPITGFRAGRMEPGFTGALVIDDPVKPDDAESQIERDKINNRWHSTFKSRLAHEDVPVIVIMQRLHVDDFSGFLLKGGAGCRWHHLLLPVEIDSGTPYPAEYTHGDPIPHGLPDGPLWQAKHTAEQIALLKTNPYVFAGQYGQVPTVAGGNLFKAEWLTPWSTLPPLVYRMIYADTAQKTGERNDYSVFQCWGMGRDGKAYLLDQTRGRFEAPELEKVARQFWAKHKAQETDDLGHLRGMKVEDKASGTGLIQSLRRPPADPSMPQVMVPVIGIPRSKDKVERANDALPSFAAGLVRIPTEGPETAWIAGWRGEMLAFPNGAHDDQVDPTMDAVNEMVGGAGSGTEQRMRAFG